MVIQPIGNEATTSEDNINGKLQLNQSGWITPSLIAQDESFENIDRITANSETLFGLNNNSELVLFDIVSPSNVTYLSRETTYNYQNLLLDQNLLYLTHEFGIAIYDISNRYDLQYLGGNDTYFNSLNHMGMTGIAIENEILYVGTDRNGIVVMNVSNPNNSFVIGTYLDGPFNSYDFMEVQDSVLYVADVSVNRFNAIDVSDPYLPTSIYSTTVGTINDINGMSIEFNTIYLSMSDFGFKTIDITDPSNPRGGGSVNRPSPITIDTIDNFVVISDYYEGIIIASLSGSYLTSNILTIHGQDYFSYDIHITQDLIYTANGENGIKVLDYGRDNDFDGLTNGAEKFLYSTDPNNSDSDEDGGTDREEILLGFNPLVPDYNPENPPQGSVVTITTTQGGLYGDIFKDLNYSIVILLLGGAIFLYRRRISGRNENSLPNDVIEINPNHQQQSSSQNQVHSNTLAKSMSCLSCGTVNPPLSDYCMECGLSLEF